MPTDFIPLLRQLNQYLEQRGRVQMQLLGLSTSEGLTLCYLLRHKGGDLCAAQLHERLGVSKAALSATLKSLCRKGYLEMEVFPDDDRKKRIIPTSKALELHRRIDERMLEHSAKLCRGIPPQDLEVTGHVLDTMLCNLKQTTTGRKIR